MQLVLDTNGLSLRKRNDAFWITAKEGRRLISPQRVSSIAVTADCLLSSAAIRLAARHSIPIYFYNGAGRPEARLWSPHFGSIARIRREQMKWAETPEATRWVIDLFKLKTAGQVQTLKLIRRRKRMGPLGAKAGMLAEALPNDCNAMDAFDNKAISECRNQIMGIEGNMAKKYWAFVADSLPKEYHFSSRTRRPALDIFNAALNYLYGMLYHTVGQAALSAGLDTHLGVLHTDQYAKPTFVFDLIEPFRPWIDQALIMACLDQKLPLEATRPHKNGLWLNTEGKRFIIELYHECLGTKVRWRKRVLTRKNHMYRFAGELGQKLLGNVEAPNENEDFDPLDLL